MSAAAEPGNATEESVLEMADAGVDAGVDRPPLSGPPQGASTSDQATQQPRILGRLPDASRRYSWTELIQMGGGIVVKDQLDLLQARLRHGAVHFQPTICKPRSVTARELQYIQDVGLNVADWHTHKRSRTRQHPMLSANPALRCPQRIQKVAQQQLQAGKVGTAMKLLRAVKSKANGSGRTYTSKYRGVHQTFPTKRWEAQFRRNGKPTSLGCFDHEEEAARAYDKMMLWCELHNAAGVKSGITNFDPTEYEKEFAWLQSITQDELIDTLRGEGRRQAAHRMMRQKREGGIGEIFTEDPDDAPQGQPAAQQQQPEGQQPQQSQQQGVPVQGVPVQGVPAQGVPVQGVPVQGVPVQGVPVQGVPVQGMLSQQGVPMQGVMPQGMLPSGVPMQGVLAAGLPTQGVLAAGMPMQAVQAAVQPTAEAPSAMQVDPAVTLTAAAAAPMLALPVEGRAVVAAEQAVHPAAAEQVVAMEVSVVAGEEGESGEAGLTVAVAAGAPGPAAGSADAAASMVLASDEFLMDT